MVNEREPAAGAAGPEASVLKLQTELEGLRLKLAARDGKIEGLEQQLREARNEQRVLTVERDALRAELTHVELENEHQRGAIEILEGRLSDAQEEVRAVEREARAEIREALAQGRQEGRDEQSQYGGEW